MQDTDRSGVEVIRRESQVIMTMEQIIAQLIDVELTAQQALRLIQVVMSRVRS